MSLTHTDVQNLIQSGRSLAPDEQALLAAHLAACPDCRAYAAFHAQLSQMLPAVYPPVRHSEREIRARINSVQTRLEQRHWTHRISQYVFTLAGALAVLVLVGLGMSLLPHLLGRQPAAAMRPSMAVGQLAENVSPLVQFGTATALAGSDQPPAAPAFTLPQPKPQATPTQMTQVDKAAEPTATRPVLTSEGTTGGAPTATPALPIAQAAQPTPAPQATRVASGPVSGGHIITDKALPTMDQSSVPAALASTPIPAVAVSGQMAYVGSGTRLLAVDISQPQAPALTAQSPELPGEVVKVIPIPPAGTLRVAASAGRYLALFDASDPTNLALLAQSKLPGPVRALIIDLNTNRIYAGGELNSDATKGYIVALDASRADSLDLLGTLQMADPVQALALAKSTLYAAHNRPVTYVSAIPLDSAGFGQPVGGIYSNAPFYSMTTASDTLYIGSDESLLAYDLADPLRPQLAWTLRGTPQSPIPGPVLGFELRSNRIYLAGRDAAGEPFRVALEPSEPITASSMVDTASFVAVSNGLMLVAGDGVDLPTGDGKPPASALEIYDILNPPALKLLGTYSIAGGQ